jgi:two-component system cell cycle response regulator DivK
MMGRTVLYIEDNADNWLLVQRVLERRGCNILWAVDGLTGLEAARSQKPDLILLDINLPDIDGYEVARRLRSDDSLRTIPIIALTANALKGDADKALAAGCDIYLPKPINLGELWARVTGMLPDQAPMAKN